MKYSVLRGSSSIARLIASSCARQIAHCPLGARRSLPQHEHRWARGREAAQLRPGHVLVVIKKPIDDGLEKMGFDQVRLELERFG